MNFKLDAYGDLVIEKNNLVIIEGIDEVKQSIIYRLKTWAGEWFLDTSLGVDYLGQVLIKNPNINNIESIIKNEILLTPGVNEILTFSSDFDKATRTLTITFTADTIYGIVSVDNTPLI